MFAFFRYMLSIETPHELEEYMGDILDLSVADNKAFVQELLRRRWQTSVESNTKSKHQPSEFVVLSKKQNLQVRDCMITLYIYFDEYLMFVAELDLVRYLL
jgi:hypothetical protein